MLPSVPRGVTARHEIDARCDDDARQAGCAARWTLTLEHRGEETTEVTLPAGWTGSDAIQLAPGDVVSVTVEGRLPLVSDVDTSFFFIAGLRSRHLKFGPESKFWRPDRRYLRLRIPQPRGPGGQSVTLRATYPAAWAGPRSEIPAPQAPAGYAAAAVATEAPPTSPGRSVRVENIRFEVPRPRLRAGGPVLKLVLRNLGEDNGEVVAGAHLGYEVGYSWWLTGELGLEVDRDGVLVVPVVAVQAPHTLPLFLGAELGAGMPVRIAPALDVAARFQGEYSFGPVGVGLGVDLWRGSGGAESEAQSTLFVRSSL